VAASDQKWIKVDTKNATSSVYYLPSSLLGSKNRRLRIKVIYDKKSLARVLDNNKEHINLYSHSFLGVSINCVNSSYKLFEEFNSSINGGSLGDGSNFGGTFFLEPRQYTKILPGTADNVWKNFACKTSRLEQIIIPMITTMFYHE